MSRAGSKLEVVEAALPLRGIPATTLGNRNTFQGAGFDARNWPKREISLELGFEKDRWMIFTKMPNVI